MNDTLDFNVALENENIHTLMLISAFGEPPFRHQARKELKNRLVYCDEQFGDDFETNLDLIF
ncbi:MAG: hypothetical protein B6I25_03700 [Planctomycetales bacterium 4572_13]|nr:MAG: hypothetical protein B6I25_03700 [Planctomycetales bacterium 4572_13]